MSSPTSNPAAPHGRNEDGSPRTPYGVNRDGSPRKSNRGARPGARQGSRTGSRNTGPKVATSNLTDEQRKGMLCELSDMMLVAPLAAASQIPFISRYIGERQTDALAGDAVIVSHFSPMLADGLILYSQKNPRALAWLDQAEEKAAVILLANVGIQMTKAFITNHFNPDPNLANAGRMLASMRMAQVAERIQAEAAAMGLVPEAQAA